ncbi:MATE family efflux transporter [Robertkochia solimangrovi]|uniref:MATE family efflux transporter n=1 Tax=Robertkochia solimangrovi TaxID=2213046 RepID=UPI0011803350|nr:MATE family efflux transporter [Robertkochia solimangrovi]TRZ42799.1 MATE family efflux transporter [Robertkochia solimangrovi]
MLLHKYTKEFRYNIKLAYPVMLGMLGHTFVAFADNIMVGQLGTAELAAVSLGNSFIFVAMSLGIGFSTAITPLVAEADAAGDLEKGRSSFLHGLVICTVLGVFLFLLMLLAKPLMHIMEQPEEVVTLAIPYLDLVAFSMIPLVMFQALKQFSDGLSLTKYPMYATVLSNIINITLNYLLIFGKFGFPQLGIIGAAIGTLVSRIVMVIFLWVIFHKNRRTEPFVTGIRKFSFHRNMVGKIVNLGLPSALQMFFEVGIFTAAIWLSGVLGTNPQAANQIALNLSSMTYMVGVGLSVAAMIRVGNQKGLKNYMELRRIAISIFALTFIVEIVFALFFIIFRFWLPTIYLDQNDLVNEVDNIEVIGIASRLLLVAAFFQISDGFQVVFLGALRGLQDVWIPMGITLVAYWFVGFPISFYFGLHTGAESMGIWAGLLAGLTTAAIFLYFRFNYMTRKLITENSYKQQAVAS